MTPSNAQQQKEQNQLFWYRERRLKSKLLVPVCAVRYQCCWFGSFSVFAKAAA